MDADLIYDWNARSVPEIPPGRRVMVLDETLRDGLQNPSVRDPSIGEKIEVLHLMESLGIDQVNIGLPAAGPRAFADTEGLAREIIGSRMKIRANLGGRTHKQDIQAMIDICERVGRPIEAAMFLGSSPIRRLVEDWSVDHLQRTTEEAVKFAVSAGLPAMYVTEDTIRTDPSTIVALYSTAIRAGARSIVLCDTVGHDTSRRVQSCKVRDRRSRKALGRKDPRRLAWAQRPRLGRRELARRYRRGRRSGACRRAVAG